MHDIINKLHPLERKVLSVLFDGISLKGITSQSNLMEVEAMRGLQWLENKKLVNISTELKEIIHLDKNGSVYLETGFPEKRFLKALTKPKTLFELRQETRLDSQEVNIAIGTLKQLNAINLGDKISITEKGKKLAHEELPAELFLKKLPLNASKLTKEENNLLEQLKKRKELLKTEITREKTITLTPLGKEIIEKLKSGDFEEAIGSLTKDIIKNGQWKKKKFRPYDIKINVPKINAGKLHPYQHFLREVRIKLLSMGFEEMEGPIIETEFYNFDALYQPQNHPARDWSDTYKIKSPRYGLLPNKKITEAVRLAHETGGKTGSTGWKYKWSETIAKQLMPRAHDTAISPRKLVEGVKIPGKYFSIVRCYRPDVIDASHGVEFNQLGGFVIDKSLDFTSLLGLLKEFVQDITGAKEFMFKPTYYPFTEPSVEIAAKHPTQGWMEIAGAGIFRPEMTEPLGYKEPVIAWGFGIDRLAMIKLGIKDIRELFTQNIEYLRKCQQ